MKIGYLSDTHFEFGGLDILSSLDFPEMDCLALAGDIENNPDRLLKVIRRFRRRLPKMPILLVLGNHEYYGHKFPSILSTYKDILKKESLVHLLEKEEVRLPEFQKVIFRGATLWTDFASGTQKETCQLEMNDFCLIKQDNKKPITPDILQKEFWDTVTWLDHCNWTDKLAAGEKVVVITHTAPSFLSLHPRFANSKINGGFCSNLEEYLLQRWKPDVWIHGHVHDPVEYEIGGAKVVCNPWGYPTENNARQVKVIEIVG